MLKLPWFGRAAALGCVLLFGSAAAIAEGSVRQPPPAEAPAGHAVGDPDTSEHPVDAPVPDVSTMDRAQLVALVEQLAEENQRLRLRLAPDAGTDIDTESEAGLHAAVTVQADQLEMVREELADLAERLEQLEAAAPPAGPPTPSAPPTLESPAALDFESAPAVPETVAAGPDKVGEYRYTYEYGLIRTEDSEVVVLRDEEGRERPVRIDVNDYRDDALKLTLYFKNTSDRPLRYTGLIALGGKRNYNDDRPPVLATTTFRTPRLQPGEVFDLSREVDVDRPWRVDVVELGKVRSYPDRP